ncbi:MAG TPA: septum formation initiator family protein [Terriglobales bacterium]|nr:septum formation initiator family protein [Terriglobales bacterium]
MKNSALKTVYAIVVLCCVAYAFVELQGPNGIPALLAKRRQVAAYEKENGEILRENAQKEQRIDRLENNTVEQEMEIRQRLKLARPGEKIYILDDSNSGNTK